MPEPKEEPTSEPKGKGEEPTAEPEPTKPPASPEPAPQELPAPADPFEGRTTEDILKDLQEHRKDDFEAFAQSHRKEAWEEGRRQGQGEGTKAFEAEKEKWAQEQQDIRTFDHYSAMADSDDPEHQEQFAKAMRKPQVKEAYDRGEKLRKGPDIQDVVTNAVTNAVGGAMTDVYQTLKNDPLLKDMTEEDHLGIRNEVHEQAQQLKAQGQEPRPYTELVKRYCELIIERGTAAGRIADDDTRLQEAKEDGRREAYDELGIEYPADEIKGRKPGRLPTPDELDEMSVEQLVELEKKGELDKSLAGHK